MLKVFKVLVTGIEGSDVIGRNLNYSTSMGYDETTKEIRVVVEKIILPEIAGEEVDLRAPHETAVYETVAERVFTEADFPQLREYMKWVVEFDVATETITDPINVLEVTKDFITNNHTGRRIARIIKERYSESLLPLFSLDQFYKNAPGFEAAVLTFYDDQTGNDLQNTTIEYQDAEVVTQQEKESWFANNISRSVRYELLDSDGKILSSTLPTTKVSAKSADFIEMETIGLGGDLPNTDENAQDGGNQYKVNLPAALAGNIKVRVIFGSGMSQISAKGAELQQATSNTYDVVCINGIANKTRLVASGSYDLDQPTVAAFYDQHTPRKTSYPFDVPYLAGFETITLTTTDLLAGDYVKLKLNLGGYSSFSELWLQLV